ncbi:acyl-CoA synthetase [soil metagenome]
MSERSERASSYNLADLFERVVDAVPDRTAVVVGERRLSFRELDERANRLAHHLAGAGVASGGHVGLHLVNGSEYLEGMLAAFKLRAVPINVNYRYGTDELRYLYYDADLVALVHDRQFADVARSAASGLDKLRTFVVVGDDYEGALEAASPDRPAVDGRSGDDIYCAYTGGTTGMPKGVLWRHEDIFFASLGGGDPTQMGDIISSPDELPSRIPDTGLVALPTPPLMHVSAHWLAFSTLFGGGTVVLLPGGRFDPPTAWRLVTDEKVNMLVIVGNAMARPLLDELDTAVAGDRAYDTSSLFVIGSGGAVLSASMKDRIMEALPQVIIVDGFGASETGVVGTRASMSGTVPSAGPRFTVNDQTAVLDDEMRPVEPGSETVGRLARRGHIPLGYYNDEEKTAETFVEFDGVRWVLPGDMATVEEDGTVVLLGRGSVSINTGGEKVYPEEVEAALSAHPSVADAVVVGVDDEDWGQWFVAGVQPADGTTPALSDLQEFCRERMARYKVPRSLSLVETMERSPSGKADYRWAKEYATRSLEGSPVVEGGTA